MEHTVEPRTVVEHTRPTLHGIAECLLAGPQHRATGEIALRTTANGFATALTTAADLRSFWREGLARLSAHRA